jgi:quercetin dioxygenase-like cupin family protein
MVGLSAPGECAVHAIIRPTLRPKREGAVRMPILHANETPQFTLPGAVVIGLASRSRGATELTTYRVRLDPGSAMPKHRHDHEEVFTVIEGSVTTVLDGEEIATGAGDTVIVPAGTEHHVYAGNEKADLIAAVPAGTVFITPDGERRVADWAT